MSLQDCKECGEQVSTKADSCPHCGVPSPAGNGLAAGANTAWYTRPVVVLTGGLAVLFVLFPLAQYGTLSPCGMVKAEAMQYLREETAQYTQSANKWEQLGAALGMSLSGNAVDSYLAGMSPYQCAKAVIRLNLPGRDFSDFAEESFNTRSGKQDDTVAESREEDALVEEWTEPDIPSWMTLDRQNEVVSLELTTGKTSANNHWNINGHSHGDARLIVPEGYQVQIAYQNNDTEIKSAHGFGIVERSSPFPVNWYSPQLAFRGAAIENPTSMSGAVQPGGRERVTFDAGSPGTYSLVCLLPGHAKNGEWIRFVVSSNGEAGFSTKELVPR